MVQATPPTGWMAGQVSAADESFRFTNATVAQPYAPCKACSAGGAGRTAPIQFVPSSHLFVSFVAFCKQPPVPVPGRRNRTEGNKDPRPRARAGCWRPITATGPHRLRLGLARRRGPAVLPAHPTAVTANPLGLMLTAILNGLDNPARRLIGSVWRTSCCVRTQGTTRMGTADQSKADWLGRRL
jgi:hypothetical protein